MRKMGISLSGLGLAAALGLLGCNNNTSLDNTTPPDAAAPAADLANEATSTTPGVANAFDHDGVLSDIGDIFADGREVSTAVGERMHACGKLQYAALGRILQTRGGEPGQYGKLQRRTAIQQRQPGHRRCQLPGARSRGGPQHHRWHRPSVRHPDCGGGRALAGCDHRPSVPELGVHGSPVFQRRQYLQPGGLRLLHGSATVRRPDSAVQQYGSGHL